MYGINSASDFDLVMYSSKHVIGLKIKSDEAPNYLCNGNEPRPVLVGPKTVILPAFASI